MTRFNYNLLAWPLLLFSAVFVTLGNGNYVLHDSINALINILALLCWIATMAVLALRLQRTRVSAWFCLLVVLPFAQLILMLTAAFLPDKKETT